MMLHFIFLFGFPVQPIDVKCVKHNKFGLTLKKITLKHIQWTFGLQYAINTTIYNLICGYNKTHHLITHSLTTCTVIFLASLSSRQSDLLPSHRNRACSSTDILANAFRHSYLTVFLRNFWILFNTVLMRMINSTTVSERVPVCYSTVEPGQSTSTAPFIDEINLIPEILFSKGYSLTVVFRASSGNVVRCQ